MNEKNLGGKWAQIIVYWSHKILNILQRLMTLCVSRIKQKIRNIFVFIFLHSYQYFPDFLPWAYTILGIDSKTNTYSSVLLL